MYHRSEAFFELRHPIVIFLSFGRQQWDPDRCNKQRYYSILRLSAPCAEYGGCFSLPPFVENCPTCLMFHLRDPPHWPQLKFVPGARGTKAAQYRKYVLISAVMTLQANTVAQKNTRRYDFFPILRHHKIIVRVGYLIGPGQSELTTAFETYTAQLF